jgi:hypothetical protein
MLKRKICYTEIEKIVTVDSNCLASGHSVVFKVEYENEIKRALRLSNYLLFYYFKCWQLVSA